MNNQLQQNDLELGVKQPNFKLIISYQVANRICHLFVSASFLIPYIVMLLLCGIPLFYMELALGQYFRRGALQLWKKICPLSKGIERVA